MLTLSVKMYRHSRFLLILYIVLTHTKCFNQTRIIRPAHTEMKTFLYNNNNNKWQWWWRQCCQNRRKALILCNFIMNRKQDDKKEKYGAARWLEMLTIWSGCSAAKSQSRLQLTTTCKIQLRQYWDTTVYNSAFGSSHVGNQTMELLKLECSQPKCLTCQKSNQLSSSQMVDGLGN